MTTSILHSIDLLAMAENYYKSMLAQDFDLMASYLHEQVHFIGPLAQMHEKESVVAAAKNFSSQF